MIKIDEAFHWLNQFEPSNLGSLARPKLEILAQRMQDPAIPDSQFEVDLDRAVQQMTTPLMNLELAEFLLQCAVFALQRGFVERAKTWTAAAVPAYAESSHRRAVVHWVAGIVYWKQADSSAAHSEWSQARSLFHKIALTHYQLLDTLPHKSFVHLTSYSKATPHDLWYLDHLPEMEADLCCTVEEAQTWLNLAWLSHHENCEISASIRPLADIIQKKVDGNSYLTADQVLNDLKHIGSQSWDYLDEPKILTLSALVAYRLGDRARAARYLRQAIGGFPPQEHPQAVARWLLGAILWQIPAEHHQAQRCWDESIAVFDQLKMRADHRNEIERYEWYHSALLIMERALKQQIQDNF